MVKATPNRLAPDITAVRWIPFGYIIQKEVAEDILKKNKEKECLVKKYINFAKKISATAKNSVSNIV